MYFNNENFDSMLSMETDFNNRNESNKTLRSVL